MTTKDMKPSQIASWVEQEFAKSAAAPAERLKQERQMLAVSKMLGLDAQAPNSMRAHEDLCALLEKHVAA